MTKKQLVERAIAFNGGPPVTVNGHIWDPSWSDADRYFFRIEKRGKNSWAIVDHGDVLNKNLEWMYESMPSSRTEEFIEMTRYHSPQVAFKVLDMWRAQERKRLGIAA